MHDDDFSPYNFRDDQFAREFDRLTSNAARRARLPLPARRYDLGAALRNLSLGDDSRAWRDSFEREESDRAREEVGLEPSLRGSAFVPLPIHERDLTVDNDGSYLIGTANPGGTFLASLQGASIASRLGAQRLPMGRDYGALPIVETAPSTMWLPVDGVSAISTTQPTVGSRLASPKALSGIVGFSKQLLAQSNPNVERLLMAELGRACAAALDAATFGGSGADGEPLGILATPGISTASGATLEWADVTNMVKGTLDAGAPLVAAGFACDPATLEVLLGREKVAATGTMIAPTATQLAGFTLASSKTGPTAGLVFCDWSTVFHPLWGALELRVDPFSDFSTGKISIRAVMYVDVLISHPAAISVLTAVS